MEKINSLFEQFKDRLTSPIFSSFMISWLVINYKIPIGLFFYKIDDLWRDKYDSYLDLIHDDYNPFHGIILPFTLALAYTFIYPPIKKEINAFNAWITARTDDKIVRLTGELWVPRKELYELRATHEAIEKERASLDNENSKVRRDLEHQKQLVYSNERDYNANINSLKKENEEKVKGIEAEKDQLQLDLTDIYKELQATKIVRNNLVDLFSRLSSHEVKLATLSSYISRECPQDQNLAPITANIDDIISIIRSGINGIADTTAD